MSDKNIEIIKQIQETGKAPKEGMSSNVLDMLNDSRQTTANTISTTTTNLSLDYNTLLGMKWQPSPYKCPHCGSVNTEYDTTMILTSNPPQSRCRCKDCGQAFFSGQAEQTTLSDYWKHDQSILGIPKIEDPMPGQDPYRLNPPYKQQGNYGWICPKCGRCLAPHVSSCPYCSGENSQLSTINTIL